MSKEDVSQVVEAACRDQTAPSDEQLVRLVLAGDERAFAELFNRYQHRAYRLAYGMTGGHEVAQDLTQEIFMRAYEKLNHFGGQARFSTWFYRLAVNRCLNYRQRERTKEEQMPDGEQTIPAVSNGLENVEAEILLRQMKDQVRRAILSLDERLRMTVLLKEIEGLSYAEIAERMGCSEGTVASRLSRARGLLARKLGHLKGAV